MKTGTLAVLALVFLSTGCTSTRTFPLTLFDALAGADQMIVNAPTQQLKTIVEPWRIRKAADILRTHAAGWRKPWHDAPVPEVQMNFMKGNHVLQQFGIGHGFVTAGDGQLWSQPLSEADRNNLLGALAIRDLGSPVAVGQAQ